MTSQKLGFELSKSWILRSFSNLANLGRFPGLPWTLCSKIQYPLLTSELIFDSSKISIKSLVEGLCTVVSVSEGICVWIDSFDTNCYTWGILGGYSCWLYQSNSKIIRKVYFKIEKSVFGIEDSEFQRVKRLSSKPGFRALYGRRRMSNLGWANQNKSDGSRNESAIKSRILTKT